MNKGQLLLVDDDRVFRLSTAALLEADGYSVVVAAGGQEAADALVASQFDLVLMDVRMPGIDGIALVEVLRTRGEATPILMISGFATVDSAVRALHAGADDFITKPLEPEVLRSKVEGLLMRRPSLDSDDSSLVGRSEPITLIKEEIAQVALADATVLVLGETGAGKELVAREIHARSDRAAAPFVAVNCAALAEGVMESELFGHVRGAFTGAVSDKTGFFLAANRGTLFLDEIGDITPEAQRRMLRVLQERAVQRVGSTEAVPTDVRLIAATNRDLKAAVAEGRFREDLYYRLNVFRIEVPPLRRRKGDIPLLVEHYLKLREPPRSSGPSFASSRVSPLAMRSLLSHDWPGNVRELFGALESALIRAGGGVIQAQHLPSEVRAGTDDVADAPIIRPTGEPEDERRAIVAALREAGGVRHRAAALLGMGRTTLWRKMKAYGLEEE